MREWFEKHLFHQIEIFSVGKIEKFPANLYSQAGAIRRRQYTAFAKLYRVRTEIIKEKVLAKTALKPNKIVECRCQ